MFCLVGRCYHVSGIRNYHNDAEKQSDADQAHHLCFIRHNPLSFHNCLVLHDSMLDYLMSTAFVIKLISISTLSPTKFGTFGRVQFIPNSLRLITIWAEYPRFIFLETGSLLTPVI